MTFLFLKNLNLPQNTFLTGFSLILFQTSNHVMTLPKPLHWWFFSKHLHLEQKNIFCSLSQRLTVLIINIIFFKLKIYFVTTFCISSQKNISERLHEKCFFNTSKHAMTLLEPLNELSFSKKFQSSTITHFLKISSHFLKLLIMSEHFSSLQIDNFSLIVIYY